MRKINDGLTKHERYRKNNPEKALARYRRHYEKFSDAKRAYARMKYRENPEYHRFYNMKKWYGLDRYEYEDLLKAQNAKCAICEVDLSSLKRRPSVDHDHETGKVRAILCGPCNVKIGVIEHSLYPKLLAYLQRHAQRKVS